MENRIKTDPYQWFFIPGILFGMLGVGLWMAFSWGQIHFYPSVIHSEIMVSGFIMTIAVGFLMTAIPRFTNTNSASFLEKLFPLLAICTLFLVSLNQDRMLFYVTVIVIDLLMIRFMAVRIRRCQLTPPPSFILVAFGLMSSLAANIILLWNPTGTWIIFSRLMMNYGLSLGLVLGVGSQLIPALLGTRKTTLSEIQMHAQKIKQDKRKFFLFLTLALILLCSFILEARGWQTIGRLIRAALISTLVLHQWRIYLKPLNKGIFSWCLWISAWMLVLGAWPAVFFPSYAIHAAHLFFIGSFSIMIFTIATRVTLAHGKHDMSLEQKSWALWGMLILMILALLARLGAPFTTANFTHLSYAALFWIMGALLWCTQFMRKLYIRHQLPTNNQHEVNHQSQTRC